MAGQCIIIMGVSGTGKSTVGLALSQVLQAKFIDGDDLHPRENITRMAAGQALNDDDRRPWLSRLSDVIFSLEQKNESGVLVCSALKKAYRDQLRAGNNNVRFIWLHGSFDCVLNRMRQRKGHFMPETLLHSQFAALETPEQSEVDIFPIDITPTVEQIVSRCVHVLNETTR